MWLLIVLVLLILIVMVCFFGVICLVRLDDKVFVMMVVCVGMLVVGVWLISCSGLVNVFCGVVVDCWIFSVLVGIGWLVCNGCVVMMIGMFCVVIVVVIGVMLFGL